MATHQIIGKKPPHFFKVVFSPVDQGIRIPTAFMREYGDSLDKNVSLKVPTGASWPIELLQTDVGTWLDKGWREFAEYYSIEERHFLVFRYDGNFQFHVIIFDPSASEIDYPIDDTPDHGAHDDTVEEQLARRTSRVRKLDEIESDNDDSVDETESDDDSIKILDETPVASGRIKKANLEKLDEDVNSLKHRLRHKMIKKQSFEGMLNQSSNAITETVFGKWKFRAYQRAKAHTSKNPFFICFMQPSYVTNKFVLSISLRLAKKYLTKDGHCDLDLRVSEGAKTWPVKCTVRTSNARIRQGWKEFVLDNSLVVGDVCVFELIRGTRLLKITIYRRN